MRVLHVTISMDASWGGPPQVVAGLASSQSRLGADVTIVATEQNFLTQKDMVPTDPGVEVRVFPRGRFSRFWTGYSRPLNRFLKSEARHYDVIHIHELWHYPGYVACGETSKRDIPYIISPHGCLAPLALSNDRLLKRIYSPMVQRPILNRASLVHVLTRTEEQDARLYGVSSPTTVIPAGVEIGLRPGGSASSMDKASPAGNNAFAILFLGRIIPNKGPALLIDAIASLRERGHNVSLTLAGPSSPDYRARLQNQVDSLNVADAISFPGFVTGSKKVEVFSNAHLFVLPSYSEGFSIASLEAMAHALPVVLSPQCNFPEAAQAGAGLEVEPALGPLTDALESLLKNPEEARLMGLKGRALVEQQYSWENIAARFLDAYRRLAT